MENNPIKKPEIVVFAGPNGSGKSTITDLLRPPMLPYEFISRQSEPKIQSAVLLMGRLAQREDKNLKRFHAILANPLLRKDVLGF